MALSVAPKEKLLRTQGPRSSSGCRTCKLRHVKCNEVKPFCGQCVKSKRPCHWGADKPRDEVKFIVYANPPREPSLLPGLTQSERRSLSHFQECTAQEIPSPFRSDLWSNVMLHVAQYAPAVRHALFALSSMHEYYGNPVESSLALHDYGEHHYSRALRQAIRTEPERSFDALLLLAVIGSAFESLKGNFKMSLQHAISGIKIIATGRHGMESTPDQPQISNDMLSNIFLSLVGQAMELGDLSVFPMYHDAQKQIAPIPSSFVDTDDALRHLVSSIISDMLAWFDAFEEHYEDCLYIPAEIPAHLQPGFDRIAQKFAAWDAAIEHVDGLASGQDANQQKGYLILKLYQNILRIIIRTFIEKFYDFDAFESDVSGMLVLAEMFLQSQGQYSPPQEHNYLDGSPSAPARKSRPVFSMALGIVPILFEIATRTRKTELRNHALRLLSSCNRREGVWDSQLVYRLAQKHIALQEEVNRISKDDEIQWRVAITEMTFNRSEAISFRYAIVAHCEHMLDSFWLYGFNPCPEHQFFQGEA